MGKSIVSATQVTCKMLRVTITSRLATLQVSQTSRPQNKEHQASATISQTANPDMLHTILAANY
uniref:Uncharacterized protein n=1 Tax=Arundo donax TaxID=35708 RepID=A0A0A9CAI3_ARUDO